MTKEHDPHYQDVLKISRIAAHLEAIQSLLGWDQETYMPPSAIEFRSQQHEIIASQIHKHQTSHDFQQALSNLIDLATGQIKIPSLSNAGKAAAREWRRDYLKNTKLPLSFVEKFAKATSISQHVWMQAKQHNDFQSFAPHLKNCIELCKEKANYLGYEEHPYDALLDLYEPGMKTSIISPIFSKLKIALKELIKEICAKKNPSYPFLLREFPAVQQLEFSKNILQAFGFSNEYSRLDQSAHPFCSALNPLDIRMTTRIVNGYPLSNIFSVIHEAGHGIYEAQLNIHEYGSPLGSAISLGIHESQSRFWETFIGKSHAFWRHFFPILNKKFPQSLSDVDLNNFYCAINEVRPSLIRVEADEVTYCLHVILRFEIEIGLVEGSIQVEDLPEVWNEKMIDLLGISPLSDAVGCLQDIHWSMGAIGYFPTYALGNIYAAQIFQAFEEHHSNWEERVGMGEFLFIREWLQTHLHQYGREFTPCEIIKKITDNHLDSTPYIKYLRDKFTPIYNL
ncbi:MAG: carboxypeptidase M32 [Chlamydiae bacterium]|nr:carboxypeptidase M32 [Chlamydiota bacterium]